MSAPTIDTHEFTRRGDRAEATLPLARLERLGSMLLSSEGALAWSLAGRSALGSDGSRQAFLRLGLGGRMTMRCVRCLEPVEVDVAIERDYRLVSSEEQAEREDPGEEDVDLLVSSRQFDLGALIEDEAIMALPFAPSHEDCAPPAVVDGPAGDEEAAGPADEAPAARNPFAALAALRGARPGDAPAPGAEPAARAEPDPAGDDASADDPAPAPGSRPPRARR